jgi:hypothetical protein
MCNSRNFWQEDKPVYFPLEIVDLADYKSDLELEFSRLPAEFWFNDSYRQCQMSMIYSNDGTWQSKKDIFRARSSILDWTEVSAATPLLKKFLMSSIFPLLGKMGRVTIIKTGPGRAMNAHYDCAESDIKEYRPKIRFVVSGENDSLYFCKEDGKKVHVSSEFDSYVIDGTRAHGMINRSNKIKYTICIGSPWNGELSIKGQKLFENSRKSGSTYTLNRRDFLEKINLYSAKSTLFPTRMIGVWCSNPRVLSIKGSQ